jgi:hypothetical protein
VRSTAFFDGAGATGPPAVVVAWVVLGLLATWVAALRQRRPGQVPAGSRTLPAG